MFIWWRWTAQCKPSNCAVCTNTMAVSRYSPAVKPMVTDGTINEVLYKKGLKKIHTNSVTFTLMEQKPNKVLGTRAPPINTPEKTLPRKTRTTLFQLRSGYSSFLNSFLSRINPQEHSDSCQECRQGPHDTHHLFNCPANPTTLTPRTHWEDPPAAAELRGLETGRDAGHLDDND